MAAPQRRIAGIKSSIPAGYVLGRVAGGEGDVGLIAITSLGQTLVASGAVSAPGASGATNYIGRQIKTATGTYTKTAGTTRVRIILLGGGGAGGGAPATSATQQAEGAGGGAGGLTDIFASVTAYDGQTVTIGAGGTAGTGTGGNGGNSTFVGLTAGGGLGGGVGVLTSVGVAGGLGGSASGGDINITGRKGWFSSISLNGGDTLSGAGAEPPHGLGAPGAMVQTSTTAAGIAATGFGAGGSGAANGASQSAATGGAGAPGLCIIDEYGPASGSGGSGGGTGTLTSLTQGTGITLTPNPITSTGTIDNAGVTSLTSGNNVKASASTGAVTLGITGLPSADLDAVPLETIEALRMKNTCYVATAGAVLPTCTYSNGSSGVGATLTATGNGALTVDGVSIAAVGLGVLVKDQASGLQNGIYTMTQVGDVSHPFILTRRSDNDDNSTSGALTLNVDVIPVFTGTANSKSIWMQTNSGTGAGGLITIGTDAPGYTLIANSVSAVRGSSIVSNALWGPIMSVVPSAANTGLSAWLNQGTASVADSAMGVAIHDVTTPTNNPLIRGRYKVAPSTPYTITALVFLNAATDTAFTTAGLAWYDGTNKIQTIGLQVATLGNRLQIGVQRFSTPSAYVSNDFGSQEVYPFYTWLQLVDDGTNVFFKYSIDGVNFFTVYTTTKAGGYLGGSGYSNVMFFINPQNVETYGTLASWTVS